MRNLVRFTVLAAALLAATAARAELVTRSVEYRQGDAVLEGYLAYDGSGPAKKPGIVIYHQWMGLTGYERMRAEQLARLGYVAFAADLYGKGVRPATPKDAGAESGKYRADRALLRARAQAALATLRQQPVVDPSKVAAIGYCFGGTGVLELARSGADVKGVVSFHGGLDSPNPGDGKSIKAKVLILHGADDPYSPKADIEALTKELEDGGVDYYMVFYGHAVHSFTQPLAGNDPSKGAAYNARADTRSWVAMKDFLKEIFGK